MDWVCLCIAWCLTARVWAQALQRAGELHYGWQASMLAGAQQAFDHHQSTSCIRGARSMLQAASLDKHSATLHARRGAVLLSVTCACLLCLGPGQPDYTRRGSRAQAAAAGAAAAT
jgi:hypothetical protein